LATDEEHPETRPGFAFWRLNLRDLWRFRRREH
jgi:hypothetical protein